MSVLTLREDFLSSLLDGRLRKGELRFVPGLSLPMVLGNDACGTVHACGAGVTRFRPGDRVYCMLDALEKRSPFGFARPGACAEYAVTREDTLALVPESLSDEEAAAIPLSALTAYQALVHRGHVRAGNRVLVVGATGGTGVLAVQVAKFFGAHVTAVCGAQNAELARGLGADACIERDAFARGARPEEKQDIVYDVAVASSYGAVCGALTDTGVYITNVANVSSVLGTQLGFVCRAFGSRRRNTHAWVVPSGEDLERISAMVRAGRLKVVLDTVYPLEDARTAYRRSERGKVTGKLVLRVASAC